MKELDEISCEIRSIVDIQHFATNHLNNTERYDGGSSNGSQMCNDFDDVCGGFLNDAAYAWLSYGCHLTILNVKTGESSSSWTFRGKITCLCQFPAQCGELPLLLVGLDNEATKIKDSTGLLCIFDCTSSRVLRAIKMPAGVEQVCIVSGGAEWEEFNDKRPDNILMQMDGIACVVLRNLHHLMIDLQRSTWEVPDLSVVMDETSPAEIEFLTTKDSFDRNSSKHMACNLLNRRLEKHIGFNREEFESNAFLDEKLTNTIISSTKIGCLISGCLGRVIIWQNDGSVGWISLPVDETMIVTHLALLEPTDDPRPFYYLWVVFQDESLKVPPLLRMFALLFERKYCDRGTNLYFNLEAEPGLKFEFELELKDRVVSLSTIERGSSRDQTESEYKRGEDSLLLISTTNKTLLFDLNQWYKEQMPRTIGECKNPNSILACYSTKHRPYNVNSNGIISCTYIPRTLQEFPNNSLSLSEELFYPNSLSFEWIELSLCKLTFWLARGVQAELLREMALTGPIILTQPSEMFHKCLSVGLVSYNTEVSFSSDLNAQRDMLLSLCLEQRWTTFLIRCAKEWSDGSAAYMYPSFLKWGIQRASSIKMIADHLCVPLFDLSGNNIGESEVKMLRFCCQQLECLSNVVAKLPIETSSLVKQRRALKRVSIYFQVLLWFYDVGLLPETQSLEEDPVPISLAFKIPYPFEKLFSLYKEKRESMKSDKAKEVKDKVLFIDELIARECPALNLQWEREAGDVNNNGYYPPPSLQSLLRSYLTDCDQTESNEVECKHQITIYLLMDLAMLLQGSYPGVDQLIKYPSSFKMSPSLIKLTQAFWLLDHEDYHGFLDMMTGQLVNDSDVKDWHHKLVLKTLIRNSHHKLALMYLHIKKPPLSSIQEQSTLIDLSVEHGLVQSAFHCRPQSHYAQLLTCFFQACKNYNKLGDILHLALDSEEEEMFVKFLEDSKSEDIKLLYYLQRCRYMEANSENSTAWFNTVASKNMHIDMLKAYNATLPDVVKRFSVNMGKTNLDADMESRYPRPMTHYMSSQKATSIYETVIRKARETYLRGEKTAIPFITAPCSTLKSNDDRINISYVMSPKVVQTNRKRTLDQIVQDEEDSGMRTPEKAKRRKLLDDSEAALTVAFSTPLVKRKICNNRDTTMGTPHSILKIRQLIRNSTSPSVSTLQGEVTDSPVLDRERKINRQIRFNIGQSKKNGPHDEVNDEEDFPKLSVSEESENTYFSPTESEKSHMESAVLSDNSFTCANVYTARPRPSLRRSYMQSSTESVNDSLAKCSGTRSGTNKHLSDTPVSALDNYSRMSSKATLQVSRRCTPTLSTSFHSTAILSPDSSFEMSQKISRTSTENVPQTSLSTSKRQDANYNSINSAPLIKSSVPQESRSTLNEQMDEDDEEEEDIVPEALCMDRQSSLRNIHKSSNLQFYDSEERENTENKCKNGDLLKNKTLDDASKEHEDNEEEFESFFNTMDSSLNRSESSERRSWLLHEKLQDETAQNVEVHASLKNGEHFDITDDESSNSGDEVVLVLDETENKQKHQLETPDNLYDASNITDDESDSSLEVIEIKDSSVIPSKTIHEQTRLSTRKKETTKKSKMNNSNSNFRKTRKNSIQSSPDLSESKYAVNTSVLNTGTLESSDSVEPRMTRSRRASSISKEINTPPLNSPSKLPAKTPRSRRASSLVKEVLIASVTVADESIKSTISSGSEESSGTASPRKIKGKRASSVAKDVSIGAESEEVNVPVRRSTRRATSVQKELQEPTKSLTKNSKVLSSSNLAAETEEKVQADTKGSKIKQPSGGGRVRKTSTRSTKDIKSSEIEVEEINTVRQTRKRCSSVPKESIGATRTRRSNSIAKETIAEVLETSQLIEQAASSPAVNTRSRRSSIQSIPEELEELLSVPSKERISKDGKKKQTVQNSRQRRSVSVELSQMEMKRRTRSTRGKDIHKDIILEEEITQTENQLDELSSKKVPTNRKRTASEMLPQEADEVAPRTRRNRKPTKQEIKEVKDKEADQFSFSQPDRTDNPPLDQKVIGEVPKYMFSPPHTRSKTMAPDHRRRINSFIPSVSEEETKKVGNEKERENILQGSTTIEKPRHYVRMTVHHRRTKFVLSKKSKAN
ncbi:Protein ELYS [Anthophora plagiata]